jgi:hypothetical protein
LITPGRRLPACPQELQGIEDQLKYALESQGDMEILDQLIAKSKFFARIGKKAEAYKAGDEVSADWPRVWRDGARAQGPGLLTDL